MNLRTVYDPRACSRHEQSQALCRGTLIPVRGRAAVTGERAHSPPVLGVLERDGYDVGFRRVELRRQVHEELSRDPLPSCAHPPAWAQRQRLQHVGRRRDFPVKLPPLAQRPSSGDEGPAGTGHHAQRGHGHHHRDQLDGRHRLGLPLKRDRKIDVARCRLISMVDRLLGVLQQGVLAPLGE
eukprot:scaffold110647_cov54-Phaeocystis_antarctica.AAC.4